MIIEDGVELFHCSVMGHYLTREMMQKDPNVPYGVKRICNRCYKETYGYVPVGTKKTRRSSEEVVADRIEHQKNSHISLQGVTESDIVEMKQVMQRMGFTEDEPYYVQWHRKHGFEIKHT